MVLKVFDDVPEDEFDKHLKTETNDAPHLVIFTKNMIFEAAVIVGDASEIAAQCTSVPEALVVLMAVYYVMDLDYPKIYSQLLGFIQHFVVGDPYTGEKSADYKHFVAKLELDIAKPDMLEK